MKVLTNKRKAIVALSALASLFALNFILDLVSSDFIASIIPSWNTTSYTGKPLLILAIVIGLLFIGLFYLIYKGIFFLLSKLAAKIKKQ